LQHVKSKNTLTLALIGSSIVLLLALQVFWLHSSYKSEISDLQKESSAILRNTIFQLRDSVFFSSMAPTIDSINQAINDGGIKMEQMNVVTDTVHLRQKSASVQIFISSLGNDSLRRELKPFTQRLQKMQRDGNQAFTIRIAADSIPIDTLNHYFKINLEKGDIAASAKVDEVKFSRWHFKNRPKSLPFNPLPPEIGDYSIHFPKRSLFNDTLLTETVRFNPGRLYAAHLTGVRASIVKEITPQILFSLFLTSLTILAFVVMYRSIKSQQRLMELKNDFISNITHELKTPVTTVGVALEALKSFKGLDNPALTSEYLDIAQNELNRLSILTDKILKASSFENSGVEYNAEPVELDKIIDQVLESLKLVFERQQAKISFTKEGTDFQLLGSSVHLTSVVYNLLDNALKYSKEIPEIEIQLKSTPDALTIIIKDHGIGISSEYKKKVFEKFFRVPTGDVHNIKGYGLGLSYVDSVVKSHRGSITVDSDVGKGSEFSIRLPKIN
jgi:two-component system, OmpR family, phosphate regulon sensor histidine kinase PhoR